MNTQELIDTARALVAGDKGLLAMDHRNPTFNKRFASLGIPQSVMTLGQVVELDRDIAVDAALVSMEMKLAMADSIILATARASDATLWTQDRHFKDIPGVKYIGKKQQP